MNRFEKTKQVCGILLAVSLTAVGILLAIDHFRAMRYGGPLSASENNLLKLGGITAIASWLSPMVLPQLAQLWRFLPWGGGSASNSQLGSLVSILETLVSTFGGDFSVDTLLGMFRTLGMPNWFYIGVGWGPDKTYAGGFGQVPSPLPAPPAPNNAAGVIVKSVEVPATVQTQAPVAAASQQQPVQGLVINPQK